jgi:GTP pyrophosphokinase
MEATAQLDSTIRQEQKLLLLPMSKETVGVGSEYGVVAPALAETKLTPISIGNYEKSTIDHYGEESVKIAAGAARLKRAEIMATIVNPSGSLISRGIQSQTNYDAEILRSFLVSLSDDWRGLVIRSAACLYRLKKISGNSPNGSVVLCKTNIGVARDAFKVYAPLAQRLGMQRLKTELENSAFRVLYPRQFTMASSLYNGDINEMKTIVRVQSSRIEQLLKSDDVFLRQIADVSVTSRVKEPYSLWKKMVRIRKEVADAKNKNEDDKFEQDSPSLKWIPDVIALRVVLSALRLSPLEDDESLRTREKMLCYYVLQLISDVWPASNRNEAKDYIKHPKKNGYQSLHYTASFMIAGDEWPFEVQIRSKEMHRVSEFGVAAHW